jgi:hypothetical protein
MIRSRLGLKVLGLCAMVLGLMAFASAAQAAKWLINGTDAAALKAGVTATIEGASASLLTTVLSKSVEIKCTAANLLGVSLEGEGKVTEGGKVEFNGCTTAVGGEVQAACKPKAGGGELGKIITNEGKGQLVLHEEAGGTKVGLTRIEPKTGETFVTIELGEKCAIGETLPTRGKLFLKDPNVGTSSVTHLISEGPLTDLWVLNKTAEHKATIDGSATVALITPHSGVSWSGDAE